MASPAKAGTDSGPHSPLCGSSDSAPAVIPVPPRVPSARLQGLALGFCADSSWLVAQGAGVPHRGLPSVSFALCGPLCWCPWRLTACSRPCHGACADDETSSLPFSFFIGSRLLCLRALTPAGTFGCRLPCLGRATGNHGMAPHQRARESRRSRWHAMAGKRRRRKGFQQVRREIMATISPSKVAVCFQSCAAAAQVFGGA